jgi:GNAT superfamily N-acetyltransferase
MPVTPAADAPPNLPVQMVRPDLRGLPTYPLPSGFSMCPFRPGDETPWVHVIRASETFFEVKDSLFGEQFGADLPGAMKRVLFVVDEATGSPVATTAAWYGEGEYAGWGRVHWVAVLPEYQARGLGRGMISHTLALLSGLGHERAYLKTSTGRTAAIKLYLRCGFVPDLTADDGAMDAWRACGEAAPPDLVALLAGTMEP